MADDAAEKARAKAAEEQAKRTRQQELDRRAAVKKAQVELEKRTVPGLVSSG